MVLDIARREDVRRVVKAKSMATEEIELAEALEAAGIETVETDLGEYVVQVAGERPSHIITPVIHKTLRQIARRPRDARAACPSRSTATRSPSGYAPTCARGSWRPTWA